MSGPGESRQSSRVWVVARTDLRQLRQSPDFWGPMLALAAIFFIVAPAVLLFAVTHISEGSVVQKVSSTLEILPASARASVPAGSPEARTSYALAVFLFAPLAVIVPMTISTAVGANILVGEKERGTGEFLAHSPATEREIYLGKVIASLVPGYLTTIVGFFIYSLIVNLIVGPQVGGWFFPTADWWVLMFWVVPPFLALTLSVVLRLSRPRAERGGGPAGVGPRDAAAHHPLVRAVERRGLRLGHLGPRAGRGLVGGRHRRPAPRLAAASPVRGCWGSTPRAKTRFRRPGGT